MAFMEQEICSAGTNPKYQELNFKRNQRRKEKKSVGHFLSLLNFSTKTPIFSAVVYNVAFLNKKHLFAC